MSVDFAALIEGIKAYLDTAMDTALDAYAESLEIPVVAPAVEVEVTIAKPTVWYVEDPNPIRHTENIVGYVAYADFTTEPQTNGSIVFMPRVDIYFTFRASGTQDEAAMKKLVAQYMACMFDVIKCESTLGGLVDYCMIQSGDNGIDGIPGNVVIYTLLITLQIGKEITF
jgi:hypothetical protein